MTIDDGPTSYCSTIFIVTVLTENEIILHLLVAMLQFLFSRFVTYKQVGMVNTQETL